MDKIDGGAADSWLSPWSWLNSAGYFPDFKIVLADLGQYTDDEIRGVVIVRAALLLLKHIHSPDLAERLPQIFGLLKGLYHSRTGLGHLEAMLRQGERM